MTSGIRKPFQITTTSIAFILSGLILFWIMLQKSLFSYRTFHNGDGWGYEILMHEQVVIYQEYIPVIQGNKPFPDRRTAKRTVRFVIKKIKNKQKPYLTRVDLLRLNLCK